MSKNKIKFDLDLSKSLKEIGQIYDIICAADEEILDGFHRDKALEKLNVMPRKKILKWCKTEEDKLKVRIHLNMARRVLPAKEKRQYINDRAEQLERQGIEPSDIFKQLLKEGYSQRTIYRYIQPRFKPRGEYKTNCHSGNSPRRAKLISKIREQHNWLISEDIQRGLKDPLYLLELAKRHFSSIRKVVNLDLIELEKLKAKLFQDVDFLREAHARYEELLAKQRGEE